MSDIDILKEYIAKIMGTTDYAASVNEAALALVGAIVWKKDDDPIEISREGPNKTSLTVKINGSKYTFSPDIKNNRIEMRGLTNNPSTNDILIYAFSNDTPIAKMQKIFETL